MYNVSIIHWLELIKKGDRLAISKILTALESQKKEDILISKQLMEQIPSNSSKSLRIGITGSPGVGKSSLIECLGNQMIEDHLNIGVLSIDPSSTISQGSILADKSRMSKLALHPNAFIRPSSSANQLGGLSKSTKDSIRILEYAGYDRIIIETVGIGQSEIDVANLCDLLIYIIQPGSGDELQAMKKGIMEWADIYVINKDDGVLETKANESYLELSASLHHDPLKSTQKSFKILKTSILKDQSIRDLNSYIEDFYNILVFENKLEILRNQKDSLYFERQWINVLNQHLMLQDGYSSQIQFQMQDISSGKITLEKAFENLLKFIFALRSQ